MNGDGSAAIDPPAADCREKRRAAEDGGGLAAAVVPIRERVLSTDAQQTASPQFAQNKTRVVSCNSECHVLFNVMPDRSVKEELRITEFRIGPTWIEAEFDRTYHSSMLNSPSHLTFVSALIQMQKVTYVYSCHRFGFDLDVRQPEVLKVWPTSLSIGMRDLVTDETRLIHRMDFAGYRKIENRKYLATAISRIGVLQIDGSAMITLLREPCSQG
jgi:hypothetical protein